MGERLGRAISLLLLQHQLRLQGWAVMNRSWFYTERSSPPSEAFNLRVSRMQTIRWESRGLDVLGSFLDAVCNTTNVV